MYIIALILFLAGMYLFGLAFTWPAVAGFIFALGILLVSAAIALPVHFGRR